jgi:sigma-B regulation protein RsbU (phosphoserine phosphatase)
MIKVIEQHPTLELDGLTNSSYQIQAVPKEQIYGSSLLKVATQFSYIDYRCPIEVVARAFQQSSSLLALGVVDKDLHFVGIVDRANFFSALGRPFGRDILIRKEIIEVVEPVASFYFNKNVFSVAQDLDQQGLPKDKIQYYGLTDEHHRFMGLFSSLDLLSYLSGITQQDLQLASKLQERMIRQSQRIQESTFSCYSFSLYAKGMGGDYYQISNIDGHSWFLTLADVSGKGVAASIITSLLWGMLRTYPWNKGLKHLLKEINSALIQTFHMEKYLTGMFGLFDDHEKTIKLADMGHSLSFLVRKNKVHHIHGPHVNIPLGIEETIEPSTVKLKLKSKDILIFITDGLVEQVGVDGNPLSAEDWIEKLLPCLTQAENPINQFIEIFNDFRRGMPQQDDLTGLFLMIH